MVPEEVLRHVEKRLVPSKEEEERMRKAAEFVVSYIKLMASNKQVNVKVESGGSYAKHTWIRGRSDIDVFVVFEDEQSTRRLRELVPHGFNSEHGTREYFVGKAGGMNVQVVPVVSFSRVEDVKNSIDFSIMHKDYILQHTDERQRRDIILLKQFCIANRCYGSEAYIHGFSGYVLELLVVHYGSFLSLFKEAADWEPGVFIDHEHMYSSKEEAIKEIGAVDNPLIVVDPTNRHRNVCGSLNLDNFARFVFAVRKFLKEPDPSFFKVRDAEKEFVKRSKARGSKLYRIVKKIKDPREKFLSQYRSEVEKTLEEMRKGNVNVLNYDFVIDDETVKVLVEIAPIPETTIIRVLGPSLWINEDSFFGFMKAHKDAYQYHDRLAYDRTIKRNEMLKFISKELKKIS